MQFSSEKKNYMRKTDQTTPLFSFPPSPQARMGKERIVSCGVLLGNQSYKSKLLLMQACW